MKIIKRLEDLFAASAFAEAGEFKTAREFLSGENMLLKKIKELQHNVNLTVEDLTSMAITFAEAGEHEKAVELLREAENIIEAFRRNYHKALKGRVLTPNTEMSSS